MVKKPTVDRQHSLTIHDPRVELWEQEGGNPIFTYFRVPTGTKEDLVQREFHKVGRKWLSNMYKDGWIAIDKTVSCLGPYLIPEYGELDMCTYYIGAMFKRRTPQVLTIEQAESLMSAIPIRKRPGRDVRGFLDQLAKLPFSTLEQQARQDRDLAQTAKDETKLREEVDQDNLRRGNRRT
ncbi:hypothetical protein LCGC14_1331560 [marine sediment metagenome]|uniref:Uncharacterized protein n=1 Tax=marine sediment metagenome TaxID=412755 RepID=A0A0F9KH72_9ZZZZ